MTNEREIVAKAKKGNSKAVGQLYMTYQSKGIAIAKQYVKTQEDAEDMYQDAFLKAMEALDRFDEGKSFQSWLDVIIVNTCKDYLRRKRALNFSDLEDPEEEGGSPGERIASEDNDLIPEAVMDRRAVQEIMEEILSGLPDSQREAVVLYYYREMSVRQIAETMAMPENTVKSNLNYARTKTKNAVEAWQKKHGIRLYSSPLAAFIMWLFFRTPAGRKFAVRAASGAAAGATAAGSGAAGAGATGAAGTATTATAAAVTSTVAATGVAAGAVTTGLGAFKITAIVIGILAIGGGATFGGIKIAQSVRENRAAETAVTAEATQGVTEAELLAAEEGVSAETSPETAELTAAVNEALDAGDFEAAETLLTEAAEAGSIPEETLEELQLLATPVMTTRTITETENYDGRTNQYVENSTLEYDGQGRVIRKTVEGRTISRRGNPGTFTYEYDEEGRILRETFVSSNDGQNDYQESYTTTITYSYDAEGRLVREDEDTNWESQNGQNIRSYTYDAAGNLVEEISFIDMNGDGVPQLPANGVVTDQLLGYSTYTYDAQGRIATEGNFNDTIYMATPAFDPARPDFVVRYEYDAAGRLVGKYYTTDNTPYETYEYDADGFLLKKTTEGWDGYFYVTREISYDRDGNETGWRETGKVELSTEEPHYVRTATVDNVYVPMRDLVQNR